MLNDPQSMTTRLLFPNSTTQIYFSYIALVMLKHNHMPGLVLNGTVKCKAKNKHSPFCTTFCFKSLTYIHCPFAAQIHACIAGRPTWQPKKNDLYRKWPGYTSQLKHKHEPMPVASQAALPITDNHVACIFQKGIFLK